MAESALDALRGLFAQYGLQDLANTLWTITQGAGTDVEKLVALRNSDAYKARFPGMAELSAAGKAIDEANYLSYEQQAAQYESMYGLPTDYLRGRVGELLVNDVSPMELQQRLDINKEAAMNAPEEVKAALNQMYGLDIGDLTAYYLDPDNAMPVLEKRAREAQVAAAGMQNGFSSWTAEQADRLYELGVDTWQEAQQGFGQAEQLRALGAGMGETLSEQDMIGTAFGDSRVTRKAQRVSRSRQSQFQGGGAVATSTEGASGAGSVQ